MVTNLAIHYFYFSFQDSNRMGFISDKNQRISPPLVLPLDRESSAITNYSCLPVVRFFFAVYKLEWDRKPL